MPETSSKDFENDLSISNVYYGLKGQTTEQIFKALSWKISQDISLSSSVIYADILRAAKNHNAAIGEGVAVIDWKCEGIKSSYVMVSMLENSINFSDSDGLPIDIVLVLISPKQESLTHLRHLSRLTRLFREESILSQLRSATCADGMISILCPENRKIQAA
ncbi:MAG TPA: PTS sugar transporter subunit IIA [Alphaproteobacteria bacterium]|nr:PTS sugar transporter subunit IIA [Alphaproteobacteria bacterium]HOO49793.1 PTS sugar transporter subunit IIA [Alphaproteobacteria bacterium]